MKLSKCRIGAIVAVFDTGEIGHVVGLTYNISLHHCGGMGDEDLAERTIPEVRFPKGTRGVHHHMLVEYKD